MCWLDDEFLVTGSRDTKMALWRVTPDMYQNKTEVLKHHVINPVVVKESRNSQKVIANNVIFLQLQYDFNI